MCAFAVCLLALPVSAGVFLVTCAGAPVPGPYPTITSALAAAKALSNSNHNIYVYGNCTEVVRAEQMDFVQLRGQDGATLTYPAGGQPAYPVLSLHDVRGFTIAGLTITGRPDLAVDLVRIFHSTHVTLEKVTIRRSGGSGLFINIGSSVDFRACIIEENARSGAEVRSNSVAIFGDNIVQNTPEPTIVRKNGGNGINATQAAHITLAGNAYVEDNAGAGVSVVSTTMFTCCEEGQRRITGNSAGISASGSVVRTWGPLLIENNRGSGLSFAGVKSQINGDGGEHIIRNNGSSGIIARGGSAVDVLTTRLEGNRFYGIAVYDNSAASLNRVTVLNNKLHGVAAYFLGVVAMGAGNSVTGSGNWDLFCTPDSLGRGSKEGIGKIFCPTFSQFPEPLPGLQTDH